MCFEDKHSRCLIYILYYTYIHQSGLRLLRQQGALDAGIISNLALNL